MNPLRHSLAVALICAISLLSACIARDFSDGPLTLDSDGGDVSDTSGDASLDAGDVGDASDAVDILEPECVNDSDCEAGEHQEGLCDPMENTCSYNCEEGFDNCDGEDANGCEVQTGTSAHCGGCGITCEIGEGNYAPVCNDDLECTVSEDCAEGFKDADQDSTNGCECVITVANDLPDENGLDTNCDGFDGIVEGTEEHPANVVFVDFDSGDDANDGLAPGQALESLQLAIDKASETDRSFVLASGGTYTEPIVLKDGVSIFGAYDPSNGWERVTFSQETRIEPDFPASATDLKAVRGEQLDEAITLDHVSIIGFDAPTAGSSTYALWVKDVADLTVRGSKIFAGQGASGDDGIDGIPGATRLSDDTCVPPQGGGGGEAVGSQMPCANPAYDGDNADPGDPGENHDVSLDAGMGGLGGLHHCKASVADPDGGTDGDPGTAGTDGVPGSPGAVASDADGSFDADGNWVAASATPPQDGTDGGGGGGGGAGGNYESPDVWCTVADCTLNGGDGGNGANGGCAGTSGTNGEPGGSSFGIAVIGGQITVTDTEIVLGDGGDGGQGGQGGAGDDSNLSVGRGFGTGGEGEAGAGGQGGQGGEGGDGGSGVGGNGGHSIGIALSNSAVLDDASNPTFDDSASAGQGGQGGQGADDGIGGTHATEHTF